VTEAHDGPPHLARAATDDVDHAAEVLRAGGLVAFPTETVYGLGADAANGAAVRRVFTVKGRPLGHPLIAHIGADARLDEWSPAAPPLAHRLAEAFWPGPLTLLVPRGPLIDGSVTGGRSTVGLRVPGHPLALALLASFGGAIAAPSANRFGRVSPTTADHVWADLGADVDVILDGGPATVGIESTILDCTTDPPQLLRAGGITLEDLARVAGVPIRPATGPSRAPGMLESHYAPRCRVVLAPDTQTAAALVGRERGAGHGADVLDPGPDVEAYARHLYSWLREADDRALDVLVVVPPPVAGLGVAINERLAKAAAPRAEEAGP